MRNKGINITAGKMKTMAALSGNLRIFAAGNTFADVEISDANIDHVITAPGIIVKSRGNIGFTYYDKPYTHKNEMWSYTVNEDYCGKYIYYYLLTKTSELQNTARATSVKLPQLCVKDTDEMLIPLPSLEKQKQIVSILDKFDKLVNDISEGLPAEIAMRRKQYEYYRNKLLTFKELKSDV